MGATYTADYVRRHRAEVKALCSEAKKALDRTNVHCAKVMRQLREGCPHESKIDGKNCLGADSSIWICEDCGANGVKTCVLDHC